MKQLLSLCIEATQAFLGEYFLHVLYIYVYQIFLVGWVGSLIVKHCYEVLFCMPLLPPPTLIPGSILQ